jgi:hypothetical protein
MPLFYQKRKYKRSAICYIPSHRVSYSEFFITILTLVEEAGILNKDSKDHPHYKLSESIKAQVAAKTSNHGGKVCYQIGSWERRCRQGRLADKRAISP